jgi:hypothetical protein
MAKQCGPVFLERTWDDLTFYKMDGKYYVRIKSRLTRKRVKEGKEFAMTMVYANLLGAASKIASSIYSGLPQNWRQFWMYQSFTGEAMKMMEEGATAQATYDHLWKTYVEYWVLYQKATGITLETGRKKYVKKAKTYKTRLKHYTGNQKCQRPNNSNRPWKRKDWKDKNLEKEKQQLDYMMKREWVQLHSIQGTWKQIEEGWRTYLLREPRAA